MRALALTILLALSLIAGTKHDFDRPVFVYAHHPDLPISVYARGELGIPSPDYARIYLYAAYRYLQDKPFTPAEIDAFLRVWKLRRDSNMFYNEPNDDTGWTAWQTIRKTVHLPEDSTKAPKAESVGTPPVLGRGFVYRDICPGNALATAARTLHERIRQFGLQSAAVQFWVKGQDRVFNSYDPRTASLPEIAPPSLPRLIQADRQYQIAAALFYADRLDEALAKFESIARDHASPWHIWAPYLIGRTIVWQARVTHDEKLYFRKLHQAEIQFQRVLANPSLSITHAAAEHSLDRCLLVTKPNAGLERLASRLMKPRDVATRESDLLMYLNGIDNLTSVEYDSTNKPTAKQPVLPSDELSLWWETFQSRDARSYAQALARWHAGGSKAWLYCALAKARDDSPEADSLLSEALKIGVEQAGGLAMHYQAARLLGFQGRFEEARAEVDLVLKAVDKLPSTRNRTLDLKFQLARNFDEMLQLAPRRVIMASAEMDANEFESYTKISKYWKNLTDPEMRAQWHAQAVKAAALAARLASLDRLDLTGARVWNEKLPLDMLRRIALTGGSLPPQLVKEVRLTVWTRSVLLNRLDVARELTPLLAGDYPRVASELRAFAKAADGRASERSAARVLLKLPGARPYLSAGYGRGPSPELHDEWGRNWWYRFTPAEMYEIDLPYVGDNGAYGVHPAPPVLLPRVPFITESEQTQSVREREQLMAGGERGLNWIAIRIADDVREHPGRSDNAETLYRVIFAAGLNQWPFRPDSDLPSTGLKAAYQLLSTRYKHTEWYAKAIEVRVPWMQ